jgi:hypothetical protein
VIFDPFKSRLISNVRTLEFEKRSEPGPGGPSNEVGHIVFVTGGKIGTIDFSGDRHDNEEAEFHATPEKTKEPNEVVGFDVFENVFCDDPIDRRKIDGETTNERDGRNPRSNSFIGILDSPDGKIDAKRLKPLFVKCANEITTRAAKVQERFIPFGVEMIENRRRHSIRRPRHPAIIRIARKPEILATKKIILGVRGRTTKDVPSDLGLWGSKIHRTSSSELEQKGIQNPVPSWI